MPQSPAQQPQQESYSDEVLEKFVDAASEVMTIQQEGQMAMVQAIEESDISVDRFNEMVTEGQQKGFEEIDATESEIEAFNSALSEVQAHQMEMETKMGNAVEEAGLEVNLYQSIMQSYETDQELRAKIDKIFAEQ